MLEVNFIIINILIPFVKSHTEASDGDSIPLEVKNLRLIPDYSELIESQWIQFLYLILYILVCYNKHI